MELTELKTMLETFKTDVKTLIDVNKKEQSDAANAEITALTAKLAEAEKGLAAIQEQLKKGGSFGLPGVEDEKRKFSWTNYIVGLYKNLQVSKGVISGAEAKRFWDGPAAFEQRVCKDYDATDGSDGAFLVPPQISKVDIIDTVYANTAMLKLPVMKLTGLKGDMPVPLDLGNFTAYNVGETEAPTKTSASLGLDWLRPKKIGVYVRVSNRLLDQTSGAIESLIRQKMAMDAAVKLSYNLTNGVGADSQCKGIMQYYSKMTGIANLGSNGTRLRIDHLASMKQALAAANEMTDGPSMGALMHTTALWGMLREKVEMYSSQPNARGKPMLGSLLVGQGDIEGALKMKIEATSQVASGTVGTSTTSTKVVVGDFSKYIYGEFRPPIFRVSDVASDSSGQSALLNDQLFLVMFLEYDGICVRPSAFCGKDGAEITESSW
jgi:HK97 family phage major capsid protein